MEKLIDCLTKVEQNIEHLKTDIALLENNCRIQEMEIKNMHQRIKMQKNKNKEIVIAVNEIKQKLSQKTLIYLNQLEQQKIKWECTHNRDDLSNSFIQTLFPIAYEIVVNNQLSFDSQQVRESFESQKRSLEKELQQIIEKNDQTLTIQKWYFEQITKNDLNQNHKRK